MRKLRINLEGWEDPRNGAQTVVLRDIDLRPIVFRWVRAFHAALYRQYLPEETRHRAIHLPFPSGVVDENGKPVFDPVFPQQEVVATTLKRCRAAKTLDTIVTNNGKLHYECAWVLSDEGRRACFFDLEVYDWGRIANTEHFPERGCVGIYMPDGGMPNGATEATRLEFDVSGGNPLDAFDD